MTDTDGTATATGSDGSLEEAANRIASLLPGDGDSDGGETAEDTSSDAGADDEDETPPDDAEESDAADETEGQDEEPQTYTVKIDGQEHTVTLEEALKGYQREQDYTRKTMTLAEDRKALEGDRQAIAQVRDQYAQALKQVEGLFQQGYDDSAEMAQLRQTNPAEWSARMTEKQQRQQSLALLQAEQQRLAAEKAGEDAREASHFADTA